MFCPICYQEIHTNISRIFFVYHVKKIHGIQTPKEYYDKYIKKEGEGLCVVCGKEVEFKNLVFGYKKYCCFSCVQLDPNVQNKIKKTNIEKYGVSHSMRTQATKNKIKQTNLKKYGCENCFENEEVKNKIKKTNIEKYGCENPNQNKSVRYKIKQTSLEKYGYESYLQNKEVHVGISEKIFETWLNKKRESIVDATIILADRKQEDVLLNCHICNQNFSLRKEMVRKRTNKKQTLCTYCNPLEKSISMVEQELFNFCKDNVPDLIASDREILDGLELDCYSESLKLGIEFDGLFWHSELHKPKNYHQNKTDIAENKEVQLIHIFEDLWYNKQEVVKSRLLKLFRKIPETILKDDLVIRIDNKIAMNFCSEHDLEYVTENDFEDVTSYGLYSDIDLMSVMVVKNNTLLKYCDKNYTNIKDSFRRLLETYVAENDQEELVINIDRNWNYSKDNQFRNMGLKFIEHTEPDYFGLNKENGYLKRESRQEFDTRKRLKKDLRIYDSGNLRYIWKK